MKKIFTAVFVLLAMVMTAQVRVYTPELNTPTNGDNEQNPDVAMSWHSVSNINPVNYKIQYAKNEDFSDANSAMVEIITGYAPKLLDFGTTYFWRVKAYDAVTMDSTDWSEVYSFTVFDQISLNKPSNNAKDEEPVLKLSWKNSFGGVSISGISSYEYWLDINEDFSSPYAVKRIVPIDSNIVTTPPLRFGEKYYWQVRAIHENDISEWSDVRNLTIIDEVELDKPKNNESDIQLDEEFSVKTLDGVLKYEVQYDVSEDFTEPFKVMPLDSGASKVYTTLNNVIFGKTYYWRARAIHQTDTSGWSEVRKVSTIEAPVLVGPENGVDSMPRQPILEWEEMTGISKIQLEYAKNADFTEDLFEDLIVGTRFTYPILYALDLNTEYFWRVRAIKETDSSEWSNTWSFTTLEGVGIEENALSGVSTYPNPVKDQLNVKFVSSVQASAEITIFDLFGKKQLTQDVDIHSGSNILNMEVENLSNGIYMMNIKGENINLTQKIIINK